MKTPSLLISCLLSLGLAASAQAKDWKTVVIATEGSFAPWNLTRPDGSLAGYEVDLSRILCARMKVECKLVMQSWDGIIPGLLAGKYDAIMSGMSATPKREEVIAFSAPYGSTGQGFGVLEDGPLANLPQRGKLFPLLKDPEGAKKAIDELRAALKGKTIGVQASATSMRFTRESFADIATVREYKTTQEHDLDLQAGRIDAIVASPAYLMTAAKDPANRGLILAGPRFQGGILGKGSSIGLRKEDTGLREMFDKAIAEAKADGTTKKLSEQWFGFDVTVY